MSITYRLLTALLWGLNKIETTDQTIKFALKRKSGFLEAKDGFPRLTLQDRK